MIAVYTVVEVHERTVTPISEWTTVVTGPDRLARMTTLPVVVTITTPWVL